ncbi:MAG: hypothetical protein ABSG19_06745 [Candidatus Aminicenantales bacterium]
MAKHKTKLELTWIGKENRPRMKLRILTETSPASRMSRQTKRTISDKFYNRLQRDILLWQTLTK